MKTSKQDAVKFQDAGFTFEYPDYWARTDHGFCVTIADGLSCNGNMWEFQIFNADMSEVILTSDGGFDCVEAAIEAATDHLNAEIYGEDNAMEAKR